jgi:hypothetical protein
VHDQPGHQSRVTSTSSRTYQSFLKNFPATEGDREGGGGKGRGGGGGQGEGFLVGFVVHFPESHEICFQNNITIISLPYFFTKDHLVLKL